MNVTEGTIEVGRRFVRSGVLAALAALLLLAGPGHADGIAQEQEIPDALARLDYMLGAWKADRVEFLDEKGEVRRVSQAEAHNERHLGGHVVAHSGRLVDPEIATRGWYYWNQDEESLYMGSVSSSGRYDEFVGGWEGDRLVMTLRGSEAFGGRWFRMTHSEISEDSFLESMSMSEDGGRTWRMTSRQVMRRVGSTASGGRPEALDAMGAYVGHWRTEDKTNQQGDTFHFEYDLGWMDEGRTIAKLVITQHLPDGSVVTLFEGFKGAEPGGGEVYYQAASPAGRAARGEVFMDGDKLITLYDGWTADGNVVKIRDVFHPVTDGGDAFVSRTFLRPSPDAEWQEIGEDRWTRTGPG